MDKQEVGVQASGGITRRQALKRGAVGGALLWSIPTLQVIGAGAAHADTASGVTPPPPPPPQKLCTPSYGLVVLDCEGQVVVVKVDENGTLDSPSDNGTGSPQDLANAILKAANKPTGSWTGSSSVTGGELSGGGLYLTWTSGCTLIGAATHDGSYGTADNPYGLDNVGPALVSGGTATFSKPCES